MAGKSQTHADAGRIAAAQIDAGTKIKAMAKPNVATKP
jgi:hypothetical protein